MKTIVTIRNALDLKSVWNSAMPYTDFVAGAEENRSLWEGVYRTTPIPEWVLKLACDRGRGVRLLAIVEDWCGDASPGSNLRGGTRVIPPRRKQLQCGAHETLASALRISAASRDLSTIAMHVSHCSQNVRAGEGDGKTGGPVARCPGNPVTR